MNCVEQNFHTDNKQIKSIIKKDIGIYLKYSSAIATDSGLPTSTNLLPL